MLPTSKDFSAFPAVGPIKLQLKNATSAINVIAIAKEGKLAKVTLASAPTGWAGKMKAILASCTDAKNDGTFKIERIDFTNNYIYLDNPDAVTQAGAAGTATLSGYVDSSICETGIPVFNGKRDIIGYQYSNTYGDGTVPLGYYLIECSKESQQTIFQAINTHATAGGLTLTAYWSLNGINWVAFVPNKIMTLLAGESDIFIFDNQVGFMKILIEVQNLEGATFYVQNS